MRANVWAIAKLDSNRQTVRVVKSSPRQSRAEKHVERCNRQAGGGFRFVLLPVKIAR